MSKINIYSEKELIKLGKAAQLAHKVLLTLIESCVIGATTNDLERIAESEIKRLGGEPLFKGYEGYKYCTCLSVNKYIVHGFPNDTPLVSGDVISIDIGVRLDGYCGDNARTLIVGGVETEHSQLVHITKEAFYAGLSAAYPGNTVGHIGNRVNYTVSKPRLNPIDRNSPNKFKVFHKVFGHGIGYELHEDPNIPNLGFEGSGTTLVPGMCICIEPVVLYGSSEGIISPSPTDQSVNEFYTSDGLPSAHHENQVYISKSGPIVLSTL